MDAITLSVITVASAMVLYFAGYALGYCRGYMCGSEVCSLWRDE